MKAFSVDMDAEVIKYAFNKDAAQRTHDYLEGKKKEFDDLKNQRVANEINKDMSGRILFFQSDVFIIDRGVSSIDRVMRQIRFSQFVILVPIDGQITASAFLHKLRWSEPRMLFQPAAPPQFEAADCARGDGTYVCSECGRNLEVTGPAEVQSCKACSWYSLDGITRAMCPVCDAELEVLEDASA